MRCRACGSVLDERAAMCTCDLDRLERALARRARAAEASVAGERFARTVLIGREFAAERGADRVEAEDLRKASAHVRAEVEA